MVGHGIIASSYEDGHLTSELTEVLAFTTVLQLWVDFLFSPRWGKWQVKKS